MEKSEQNVLKTIPEQHAMLVRKNGIAEGKTRPILPNREVQTCNPHDQ